MIAAFIWSVVALFLALWSLTAWALHGLAAWTVSNAGAWSGVASGVGPVRWPDALAAWVPPGFEAWVTGALTSIAPLIDSLLQAAPALASGLTVVAWVVWAIGASTLLLGGAALHGLIAVWRRRSGGPASGAGTALAAG